MFNIHPYPISVKGINNMSELKTPLYDLHVKYGGRLVPFAGYLLPVQYAGITAEHMAVRTAAGLFDVSHMGEISLTGPDALQNVQNLLTNDFSTMTDGQARYSPMCNENGGIVDDLLVYRKDGQSYLLVVNASNREKDAAWIKSHLSGDVTFKDESDETAQLALQGPKAQEILCRLAGEASLPEKYYTFKNNVSVGGLACLVSRTGYTGEDGYELYTANENAEPLWEKLMEAGRDLGLVPCGLGARDTLRLEAAMPLYGHEMTDDISPLETGLNFAVKMQKDDFIGKAAIAAKGEPTVRRVGLELLGRGIAREHDRVFIGETEVGYVTSGTMCPYLNKAVAMAIVPKEVAAGDEVIIEVRGKKIPAKVVPLPFYKKS